MRYPSRIRRYARRRFDVREVLLAVAILGFIVAAVLVDKSKPAPPGSNGLFEQFRTIAAEIGLARLRPPQTGDLWSGCNQARAAGTAPIYRGEPGYSDSMDIDGDGVACEPYHGE